MNAQIISKEQKKKLEHELDFLKTTRRKEIADKLEFARSLGDLSENAEYKEARDEQGQLEERIAEIEQILLSAQVLREHDHSKAEVGATVVVQKKGAKSEQEYMLVSPSEASLSENKISYESPLGSAMMGKKKGESFVFVTPKGKTEYTVIKIK
jgi:transcription elongation factor GreA